MMVFFRECMSVLQHLGLRKMRERLGLTQGEMAGVLGVSRWAYARRERDIGLFEWMEGDWKLGEFMWYYRGRLIGVMGLEGFYECYGRVLREDHEWELYGRKK